ncbi:EamA family transporter [Halorientalis brevis]|uniref:EamA family transporter n=1 Tax=Halorientalis brevis TaxID=1126241 RepID=A0ABD6CDY5_9EURY|nr:EamA family transporter [Halorientalis brevis]
MRYLSWALLALASYTLVAPLVKLATAEIPSDVALLVANGMLVIGATVVVVASDTAVVPYLTDSHAIYAYGAGICLTIGILAYYRALAAGPVSVVVPIFGLFIVTSSIIGMAVLDEPLTARKLAGIGFAILAVYLTGVN